MPILWAASPESGITEAERETVARLCPCPIETAAGALDALEALENSDFEALIGEFPAAECSADEWLEAIQRRRRNIPVVILAPSGTCDDAVRLTKLGAFHFLGLNTPPERIAATILDAASQRDPCEPQLELPWMQSLVGRSRTMRTVAETIRLIAPRRATVLITGETGTGKEIAARALHAASGRTRPLVAVNCNALPEALLEAELFGHVRGAFTGAVSNRIGRFEQAHQGTLFLDEIGDMQLDLQAKLLRVLQERELQRLGSSETVRLNVRVVAASNSDLGERVRQGRFREDLYYRLNVVPIRMPPLRERPEDVPLLAKHFVEKICTQEGIEMKEISRAALDRLTNYCWPGNVRQLENAVEMAVALNGEATILYPGDFPLPAPALFKAPPGTVPSVRVPEHGLDFERTVSEIERNILEQALARTGGNKKQAAEMLRLKRTTLSAKLKSLAAIA